MIEYMKVSGADEPARYLARRIRTSLGRGQKTLLLIPGGSAIAVAAAFSRELEESSLSNLTVSLTDERYGPPGHRDSNWHQLRQAGFKPEGARLEPVLKGRDIEKSTADFRSVLRRELREADFAMGLFGIGADGHTAGILPGSPAINSNDLAISYHAGKFERITITAKTIARLDEAIVYAVGDDKNPALEQLAKDLSPEVQPAQILKRVNKLTVYNDYKGESS